MQQNIKINLGQMMKEPTAPEKFNLKHNLSEFKSMSWTIAVLLGGMFIETLPISPIGLFVLAVLYVLFVVWMGSGKIKYAYEKGIEDGEANVKYEELLDQYEQTMLTTDERLHRRKLRHYAKYGSK